MTELPPGASPVDAIAPGTRLREWEVLRFRARGSYGVVFEARRSSWLEEPPRALKVFDPIVSSAARNALLGEFSTLTAIRHPHLLAGIDAFDLDTAPFAGCVVFVLELAEEDLSHRMAHAGGTGGPAGAGGAGLAASQVAAIGAEVATGLAALHDMGRIHGDVKPENILRVDGRWVLGDFGVTSVLEGSYAFTPGTTIDYRPPELAQASQGVRLHRSADIWALGVSLYVAATGRHPFPGPDPMMRYAAVVRGDRPAVPAHVDPALWSLIESGCLDPDPRRRLDAATLAAHLRTVAGGGAPAEASTASWSGAAGAATPAGVTSVGFVAPHPGAPSSPGGQRPSGGWTPASLAPTTSVVPWAVGAATAALVVAQVVALIAGALVSSLGARRGIYVGGSLAVLAAATAVVHARLAPTSRQLTGAAVAGLAAWTLATVQLLVGIVG